MLRSDLVHYILCHRHASSTRLLWRTPQQLQPLVPLASTPSSEVPPSHDHHPSTCLPIITQHTERERERTILHLPLSVLDRVRREDQFCPLGRCRGSAWVCRVCRMGSYPLYPVSLVHVPRRLTLNLLAPLNPNRSWRVPTLSGAQDPPQITLRRPPAAFQPGFQGLPREPHGLNVGLPGRYMVPVSCVDSVPTLCVWWGVAGVGAAPTPQAP